MLQWVENLMATRKQARAYRDGCVQMGNVQKDYMTRHARYRSLPIEIAALDAIVAERRAILTGFREGPISYLEKHEANVGKLAALRAEQEQLRAEFDPVASMMARAGGA